MEIQKWKKEMAYIVNTIHKEDRFDLVRLYKSLRKSGEWFIARNAIEEGTLFKVLLESGSCMELQFFRFYTLLTSYGEEGRQVLVNKTESIREEYKTLEGYAIAMKENKLGVGAPYPEEFKNVMQALRPGELIVFDRGISYAEIKKEEDTAYLKKACSKTDAASASDFVSLFKNYKTTEVDTGDKISLQRFWNLVGNKDTYSMNARVEALSDAQLLINKCAGTLAAGQTKKLDFGVIVFHVKRSRLKKVLKWYSGNGESIDEDTVKVMIAWLNAAPVITEFKRADNNAVHDFNDRMIKESLESLYRKKDYATAYRLVSEYCRKEKGSLSVSQTSYVKNGMKYGGVSFLFTQDDVFKLEYPDGDFTKDAASIKKADIKEFTTFCEEKYNDSFISLKNEKIAAIREQYKSAPENVMEKVAEHAAMRELEETIPDIDVSIVEQDVSTLADSFKEQDSSLAARFENAKEVSGAEAKGEINKERKVEEECL